LQRPWLRSVVLRSADHGVLYSYAKLSAYALAVLLFGTTGTQDAIANGDTRTIDLVHTHTKESASITFKRNGTYDAKALQQLNWFLRDWRTDQPTKMEPRLFDIVWEVYRSVGASEGIYVVSAYRAPETNARLRRRSKAVSKYSQHMAGKAMDLFLPGVDIARVRATAMRLEYGGVGFYPSSADSFIHLDVGSVRAWPRMTRGQLLALFPDGKTVHLPSSGPPLPRYEEARVEVLARGATVRGVRYASADGTRRAMLVGGGDDEQEFDRGERILPAPGRGLAGHSPTNSDDASASGVAAASLENGRRALRATQTASAEPPPAAARGIPRSEQSAVPETALALAPMPPRPDAITALSSFALPPGPPSLQDEIASASTVRLATRTDATTPNYGRGPDINAAINPHLPAPWQPGAATDDRAQLRALFAAVLTRVDAGVQVKVATARVKTQADVPSGLIAQPASGFGLRFSRTGDELRNRFTGPAVKLPSLLW
jgi:uncharacterized protein YcbK (DUF882 family)